MSEVAVLVQEMTSAEEAPSTPNSFITPPYDPLWTTQDVEQLPNFDGIRIEILHGELILSKLPSWEHQIVSTNIAPTGRVGHLADPARVQRPSLTLLQLAPSH